MAEQVFLRSLTLRGFKSFPDRTRLEFGPGVSVVVGPNGSGKSNVTDAVLWAMGEQSPLAVRGQSMQDVIFAGGPGQRARQEAVVELVLDNADGSLPLDLSEISIVRRLDRAGEGEYRLNGARCRLVDVLELLSDTGLGKESHSVVSQGRVEAIVTSKPRDRRLLIEEAAGLGKHRKRRRRAQLKLARTQENLDRALDVEREARSRLRPLKRQAEAAELHARLERQTVETRWELVRDVAHERQAALAGAERAVARAHAARAEAEQALAEITSRRQAAEEALAQRGRDHDLLASRCFAARAARDRIALRVEHVGGIERELAARCERQRTELVRLEAESAADREDPGSAARMATLEAELSELAVDREQRIAAEVAELERERARAGQERGRLDNEVRQLRDELAAADERATTARTASREAEAAVERARREAARVGAELAAVNQFLRSQAGAPGGARALADDLEVDPGYELALAAALGGRLGAAVVPDLASGEALLDRSGADGGSAIVASGTTGARQAPSPPAAGAERLLDHVRGEGAALELATTLLADAWVVPSLGALAVGFEGTAVTRGGRVWLGAWHELRQLPAGGAERILAERNRREQLVSDTEHAAAAERAALAAAQAAAGEIQVADAARAEADAAVRERARALDVADEELRRLGWRIERRRGAPDEGPQAVRHAQLEAELRAERRLAEQLDNQRRQRLRSIEELRGGRARAEALLPVAARLSQGLRSVADALAPGIGLLEAALAADREAGEQLAAQLRACAQEEAAVQSRLREHGDAVTTAEVQAQRSRDLAAETQAELGQLALRLELPAEPSAERLEPAQRIALEERIARLARRREQLGPVNPLAQAEYAEAVEHVEQLERQREDLESALRELEGLIRETDRRIHDAFEETFTAAARNFEDVVGQLFPGGRGRLRLVQDEVGPRSVLGGQPAEDAERADRSAEDGDADAADTADREDEGAPEEQLGVEIEITPAGKAMKRLSLLSGGEKSLTALAFLFAVFLARPCPFYILDEVEAALDDLNIDRFLTLLRRYAGRAQFIVVTHQKRTMEAADWLYGVSMGDDGVSRVLSRRLGQDSAEEGASTVAEGSESTPAEASEPMSAEASESTPAEVAAGAA